MRKKVAGLSVGLYLGLLLFIGTSDVAPTVFAQVACSVNGYDWNAWPNDFRGSFYWDGSTPSSLNNTILSGMAVWNNANYHIPVFGLTSDAASANGVVRFTPGIQCNTGMEVAACTAIIDGAPRRWSTDFNSHTCYVSSNEGGVAGCYNVGHVEGHEYGHVMTLSDNYQQLSGGDDSLVGNIYLSTQPLGTIRSRLCADNTALNNRYGLL